jgi:hypothetical protein
MRRRLVSGGSAGGLTVFLGLDFIAARFPPAARVVGAPDAGFFIDAPQFNSTALTFGDEFAAADASTLSIAAAFSQQRQHARQQRGITKWKLDTLAIRRSSRI